MRVDPTVFDAPGLQMTTLADVAEMLREARRTAGLSQQELADRAATQSAAFPHPSTRALIHRNSGTRDHCLS